MPGHTGTIYAASNAVLTGRGTARTITVLPDGRSLPARSLQKVLGGETGSDGVVRRLISYGATVPRAGTDLRTWLPEALDTIGAYGLRHRGCWRYAMYTARRFRRTRINGANLPYPKHPDPITAHPR